MQSEVITLANKKSGTIELDEAVFAVDVRRDILARAVNWQLAKRRGGNAHTKGRSDVAATKAKPFNQKGSGRARAGTTVAPQMRGGGVTFGPRTRSHAHKLQKKVRVLALKSALSAKQAEGKLVILDEAKMKEPKTAQLVKQLDTLNWGRTLVIDGLDLDTNFVNAAGNIANFDVLPSNGANVYDILRRDTLVLTRTGVEKLVERLK
ncbi:MAG: 50S ribosomal protein L4 [Alphaproteobacteria bacterium]|jgi:large subunit ribosomal protein L4|nr:50S ribosomal protein L4 [Alphaproteobacteria bacterium]